MPDLRRILHVVHGFYPESAGGTEAYVRSLLASQQRAGLEPVLLHGSFAPRGAACLEARDDLEVRAFRLHRADTFSDFWDKAHYPPAGELFRDLLGRERPDLVHVHQWIRLTDDLVEIAEGAGIPTVVSLHDVYASCPACFRLRPDDLHCERLVSVTSCLDCVPLRGHEDHAEVELGIAIYRANFRHELLRARRVLAATEATRDLVMRGLGLPHDLVQILPLGYERRFAGLPQATPGDGPLRLAYWGNITHRKGTQVLLEALGRLRRTQPLDGRLELHLFGKVDTEALRHELTSLAADLPVHFHGRYEYRDLAELGMHVAVFPSTCFETYGFVLDEAFELGVPALVTDVGAFAERLQGAGFRVPARDAAALAEAIGRILDDPGCLDAAADRIPPLSPEPDEHARLLLEHYRAALATRPAHGEPLSAKLRAQIATLRARGDVDCAPGQRGLDAGSD